MIGICLAAAGLAVSLPLTTFTVAWDHSIEKIRWEEDYRVIGQQLQLTQARIHGSGAGMEPSDGAVFKDGAWHYTPSLAPLPRLRLTRSPYTADYSLCWDGRCTPMAELAGPADSITVLEIFPCGMP